MPILGRQGGIVAPDAHLRHVTVPILGRQGGIVAPDAHVRHVTMPILGRQGGIVAPDAHVRHVTVPVLRWQGGLVAPDDHVVTVPMIGQQRVRLDTVARIGQRVRLDTVPTVPRIGQPGVRLDTVTSVRHIQVVVAAGVVMHDVMDDVHMAMAIVAIVIVAMDVLAMAQVLRHSCHDRLRQPLPFPGAGATFLLVGAAPALLGLGPAEIPVLEAGDAVVVLLFDHMLHLGDGNLLVDGLSGHRNGHVDDLPRHLHWNCHRLVAVLRWRRHGLRHVVLLGDVMLHHVGRASRLNLDDRPGILGELRSISKHKASQGQPCASEPHGQEPSRCG